MGRRFGVGLFDVGAAVLVLIVLIMPGRDLHVASGYKYVPAAEVPEFTAEVAQAQAEQLARPSDGAAAEKLAMLLGARPVNQHDQAIRLAGAAAGRATPESRWRPLLAVSSTHADRIEIAEALEWAKRALAACNEAAAGCPDHEQVRLELYTQQLEAGMQAIARGADPRAEPERFRREMSKIHPTTTYRVRSGRAAP
jgi:hypothetical protein